MTGTRPGTGACSWGAGWSGGAGGGLLLGLGGGAVLREFAELAGEVGHATGVEPGVGAGLGLVDPGEDRPGVLAGLCAVAFEGVDGGLFLVMMLAS